MSYRRKTGEVISSEDYLKVPLKSTNDFIRVDYPVTHQIVLVGNDEYSLMNQSNHRVDMMLKSFHLDVQVREFNTPQTWTFEGCNSLEQLALWMLVKELADMNIQELTKKPKR